MVNFFLHFFRRNKFIATSVGTGLLLGVLLLVTFNAVFFSSSAAQYTERFTGKQEKEYWQAKIKDTGARSAYNELKEAYQHTRTNIAHNAAHIFGSALYAHEGLQGIAVCDSSFSFGCYHELLGQAIAHEGLAIVYELNEICRETLGTGFFGCQHGIGHGILAHIGYEDDNLVEALELCNELPYTDDISGCYGGAVMEYNVRTMLSIDGVPIRALTDNNYTKPCEDIPEYARLACYYWQAQWWELVLSDTSVDTYRQMGEFCAALEGDTQNACYMGIGNNTSITTNDPDTAIELCSAATKDSQGHEPEILCRASAAASFAATEPLAERSQDICEGLAHREYQYCNRFRENQVQGLSESIDNESN